MARKSPAFSFYPDSWRGGTSRLSWVERGIYIELLSDIWLNGPVSREQASAVCLGVQPEIVDGLLSKKFVQDSDGNWFNERLEFERKKQQIRKSNGVKGGRPVKANQKLNQKLNETKTKANSKHSDSDSDSSTDTKEKSLSASESGPPAYSPEFEEWWSNFPKQRRSQKGSAYAKWKRIVKDLNPGYLLQRVRDYAASDIGKSEFAVMPERWLNSRMWEDDPASWERKETPSKPEKKPFSYPPARDPRTKKPLYDC